MDQDKLLPEMSKEDQNMLLKALEYDPVSLAALKAASDAVLQPKKKEESTRKAYVPKACVNCKASHVGCDASRPCKRCVRLNKQDTCVDAERKKRGRPSNSMRNSIDIMQLPKGIDPHFIAAMTAQAALQQQQFRIQQQQIQPSKPPTKKQKMLIPATPQRPILPSILPQTPEALLQRMIRTSLPQVPPANPVSIPEHESENANEAQEVQKVAEALNIPEDVMAAVTALSMLMPLNEQGAPDFSALTKPEEEQTEEEKELAAQIQQQLVNCLQQQEADPSMADEIKKILTGLAVDQS